MAIRSALASLPARLRTTSAATVAGGWQRFLSHDPIEARSTEDTFKDQAEDRLEDPRMKEELPTATRVHSGPKLLLENVLIKRELDFERKSNEHRAYFELKKREAEMKMLKTVADSKGLLSSFNRECISRLHTAENIISLQNNKLSILKNSEDLRILQAHVSILKGIPWFVITVVGGSVTIYCRLMGIL